MVGESREPRGSRRTVKTVPPPLLLHKDGALAVLGSDVLAFVVAFTVAMHLRFNVDLGLFEPGRPPWGPMLNSLPVMLAIWLGTLWSSGLYNPAHLRLGEEAFKLLRTVTALAGILLALLFFYRGFSYSRGFTLLFLPLLFSSTFMGRLALRVLRRRVLGYGARTRMLVIGTTSLAQRLIEQSTEPGSDLEVVGVLDDVHPAGAAFGGSKVLGRLDDMQLIASEHDARGVIVASKLDEAQQLELLDRCLASQLEWYHIPTGYELMLERMRFEVVGGVPVLTLRQSNIQGLNRLIKRGFDIVVSTLLLLLLSPLMLTVALLIRLTSKGPIFFTQDRVGEGGRSFSFLKFRTMYADNDDSIHREYAKRWIEKNEAAKTDGEGEIYKIERDPRVIPIGHFLRRFSIDELPQLINVLRGDMSLIGPRPPIPYEVEVYRQWHRRRFAGPQGITGLWQVSGRNRLSFDEMVKLDIEYVENWSLLLDLKILWRTVGVVLFDRAY